VPAARAGSEAWSVLPASCRKTTRESPDISLIQEIPPLPIENRRCSRTEIRVTTTVSEFGGPWSEAKIFLGQGVPGRFTQR
jgi:hypothetical protein